MGQSAQFSLTAANGGAVGQTTGNSREGFIASVNYVVLGGVASDTGSLSIIWGNNPFDPDNIGIFNGLQLQFDAIPEPSTTLLILLFSTGLL